MAEREPEEIEQEIEQTREELGETVEALAEKADVKAQAQEKVEDRKAQARARVAAFRERARERVAQAKAAVAERKQHLGGSGGEPAGPGIAADESSGPGLDPGQVVAAAKENPVPVMLGALLAGFLIGRRSSR